MRVMEPSMGRWRGQSMLGDRLVEGVSAANKVEAVR